MLQQSLILCIGIVLLHNNRLYAKDTDCNERIGNLMIYILIVIGIVFGEYKIKNYIEEHFEQGEEKKIFKGKIKRTSTLYD